MDLASAKGSAPGRGGSGGAHVSLPLVAVQHAQVGSRGHVGAPCWGADVAQHTCFCAPPWASTSCNCGSALAAASWC
eukprot:14744768-Alexandrium_andersonii.AAC.1